MTTPRRAERLAHDDGPDDAAIRAMDALRRLVRVLSSSARGRSHDVGPSGAQLFVLRQIAAAPGLSIGDLAARTLGRQSTVSEVVARLVSRGLVVRRPGRDDARHAELTLTAAGEQATAAAETTAQERLAQGLAALRPGARAALADGLDAWLAAAGFDAVPATMFFEDPTPSRPAAQPPHRPDDR